MEAYKIKLMKTKNFHLDLITKVLIMCSKYSLDIESQESRTQKNSALPLQSLNSNSINSPELILTFLEQRHWLQCIQRHPYFEKPHRIYMNILNHGPPENFHTCIILLKKFDTLFRDILILVYQLCQHQNSNHRPLLDIHT